MSGSDPRDEHGGAPWLELAIGALGALIVSCMAGYPLFDAFGRGDALPADIVLEQGEFSERSAGWHVPVLVRNLGDEPAEAVVVQARLALPDGRREEAALTLAFLPPRGEVEAAFLFVQDPAGGELEMRTTGYLRP